MAQSPHAQAVPSSPLVDPNTGEVDSAWRAFLVGLYNRSGGATGQVSASAADLAAETKARSDADAALSASLTAEIAARTAADAGHDTQIAAEQAGRRAGDIAVSSAVTSLHTSGTGAPTSTQAVGSLYSRTDGTVGATLYVSRGGGVWNAVAGV
jgi:hypothetical protein